MSSRFPTLDDLPVETQQLLKTYTKTVAELYGSTLDGLMLYGSAARNEFLPGRSNLNLVLFLTQHDGDLMRRYARIHRRWNREHIVVPLFLTEPDVTMSAAVFPLEYLELQDFHRLLYGRDPLIGLRIDTSHLRMQILRELSGNVLRLRQRFVEGGGSEEAMAILLLLSLTSLLPSLRGIQRLRATPVSSKSHVLLKDMESLLQLDLAGLLDVLYLKRGQITPGTAEVPRLFDRYLACLERLVAKVDAFLRE